MENEIAAFIDSLELNDIYHCAEKREDGEVWLFVAGDITLYGHTYTADDSYPITENGEFNPEALDILRTLLETSAEGARECCEEDARKQAWEEYLARLEASAERVEAVVQ